MLMLIGMLLVLAVMFAGYAVVGAAIGYVSALAVENIGLVPWLLLIVIFLLASSGERRY